MRGCWYDDKIKDRTKFLIFTSQVRNTLMSGQEPSVYSEQQIHRLEVSHCKKLRILNRGEDIGEQEDGSFQTLSNEQIRTKLGYCTIRSELRNIRLEW